jgi:hypothetical protein
MKIIIAGSRTITDYQIIKKAIEDSQFQITEIVSGGAVGVDRLGERYARENKIPVKQFIPDWSCGKVAGLKRNTEMANYGDALIAIWDGESRGTKHMIAEATKRHLKIFVVNIHLPKHSLTV